MGWGCWGRRRLRRRVGIRRAGFGNALLDGKMGECGA